MNNMGFYEPRKMGRWHIDQGVVGKYHGLSYCENCDYVPPRAPRLNKITCEIEIGNQQLTLYCPNCGRRMINGKEVE